MRRKRNKAMKIISDINGITKISNNHFTVKSQSSKNLPYKVKPMLYHVLRVPNTNVWQCQCNEFWHLLLNEDDKLCKHIEACRIFQHTLQQQNRIENSEHPRCCPKCKGYKIRKNGFRIVKNDMKRQRFSCATCKYQFIQNNNKLGRIHNDPQIVAECLNLVMSGMSYRETARHIEMSHSIIIHNTTVLNWVKKFTYIIKNYVELFYPTLGDVWSVDEMDLNVKDTKYVKGRGFKVWLWSSIDPKTRFLIATQVSKRRATSDARKIMKISKNKVIEIPSYIITDCMRSYDDAIIKEFHNRVAHVTTPSIHNGFLNRPIERYHNEIRAILKSRRGLGNEKSAQTIAELLRIHHNFVKKHMGLDGKTPAEVAGIDLKLGKNPYLDLIKQATAPKKEYDIIPQLGNRIELVEIINENDCVRVVQKKWIKKGIWRQINDILRLNGFVWLSYGEDSCWFKEIVQ